MRYKQAVQKFETGVKPKLPRLGNKLMRFTTEEIDLDHINNFKWSDLMPGWNAGESPLLFELRDQFKTRFSKAHYKNLDQSTYDSIYQKINSKAQNRLYFGIFLYSIIFTMLWATYFFLTLEAFGRSMLVGTMLTTFGCFMCASTQLLAAGIFAQGTFRSKLGLELDDKAFINLLSKVLAKDRLFEQIFTTVANTVSTVKLPSAESCRQSLQKVTQLIVERQDKDRERNPRRGPKITPAVAVTDEKDVANTQTAPIHEPITFSKLGKLLHEGTIYQMRADPRHFGKNAVIYVAFSTDFKFGQDERQITKLIAKGRAGRNDKDQVKYEKRGEIDEIVLNIQRNLKPIGTELKASAFETWLQRIMPDQDQRSELCNKLYSRAGGRDRFRIVVFEEEKNHAQRGFSKG